MIDADRTARIRAAIVTAGLPAQYADLVEVSAGATPDTLVTTWSHEASRRGEPRRREVAIGCGPIDGFEARLAPEALADDVIAVRAVLPHAMRLPLPDWAEARGERIRDGLADVRAVAARAAADASITG